MSAKRYRVGELADLAPVDLAMGWGRMAMGSSAEAVKVWQQGRWYYWQFPPGSAALSPHEVSVSSANQHMIPSSPEVARVLAGLGRGDYVKISGWLVNIRGEGGRFWTSSVTRDDTGREPAKSSTCAAWSE